MIAASRFERSRRTKPSWPTPARTAFLRPVLQELLAAVASSGRLGSNSRFEAAIPWPGVGRPLSRSTRSRRCVAVAGNGPRKSGASEAS